MAGRRTGNCDVGGVIFTRPNPRLVYTFIVQLFEWKNNRYESQAAKSLASLCREAPHSLMTDYFPLSFAAFTNPTNSGCGRFGRDKNSG